ncbi:hypothetical protein [Corynebacterium mastitidis]|uniref:hypothetical protein n=1 Tax=Corynebacterium mastitidis TaxID=161890 RepID=UPI00254F8E58|nr:hypothetical protein [Corynebacterium mastitidis]MDK8450410.1 hypothetical protein [Corynebacterium mastitidis]
MKKKIIACLSAAAMAPAALAPAATAAPRPSVQQCSIMHKAVDRGESVPNMDAFALPRTNLNGTTLRVVAKTKYKDELRDAIQAWDKASGGKIKIEIVPEGTPGAVPIEDISPATKHHFMSGPNIMGVNLWNPSRIILNLKTGEAHGPGKDEFEGTRIMTIAHEMGHAMGINHTCKGDAMSDGAASGGYKMPNKYDAALVLQRAQRG